MNALIKPVLRRYFRSNLPAALCAGFSLFAMWLPVRSDPAAVEHELVTTASSPKPTGLDLLKREVEYDIVSDTSWLSSPTGNTGWQEISFDDSAWTNAVVVGYPYPPGNFIPGTAAQHVWEAGTTSTSPAYFRRSFWLPLVPGRAQAVLRIDDGFEFYVNGVLVGAEAGPHAPRTYNITPRLVQGINVFALKCWNTISTPRSMLFDADIFTPPVYPQATKVVVSDLSWRGSPSGPTGWQDPAFDDSSWPGVIEVSGYPYPPGGYIPGTTARHIWTNPYSAGRAFLRKTVEVQGFIDVTQATVRVDDAYNFYVNGMLVGSKHTVLPAGAQSYDITSYLRHGTNVFAIEGWDIYAGGHAALFDVDISYYRNLPPNAAAGGNRIAEPGATVHLNGSASSDDFTLFSNLDFAWTIESAPAGSSAVLTREDTPYPVLVPDVAGDYTVKLVVTDEQGLSGMDTAMLTAAPLAAGGSFEDDLTGWTATGNLTIQSGPPYTATDGIKLISFNDHNRTPDGVLSQVVSTVPGMTYRLEFDVGVLAYNTRQQRLGLEVSNGSVLLSDTIVLTGRGGGAVDWVAKSYLFTAESPWTSLVFRDLSTWTNSIDLLLDNVRVTSTALPLLVTSLPQPGVPIEIAPVDVRGYGNDATAFDRIYHPGTMVELIAPGVHGGRSFFKWLKDGSPFSTDPWIEVLIDDAFQMTAVYLGGEPVITEQPVNAVALENGTAEFRVVASGGIPMGFQWRFEGAEMPGEDGPSLIIDPVRPEHQGTYDVVVTNTYGTVTSDPAELTIGPSFTGLENGGFESDFQGWTVSGNLEVKSTAPYAANEGVKLAAFNAANTTPDGVLFQVFDTTPGQPYLLSFDMGVLAYNTRAQTLEVEVTGSPSLIAETFTMNGAGGGTTVWRNHRLSFTADSPRTTVTFRDVSPWTNGLDLLLDDVVVTPVIVHTLTVTSDSGGGWWTTETVGVAPPDILGEADGQPVFNRSYPDGAQVNLTAPPKLRLFGVGIGLTFLFQKWVLDGADYSTDATATVLMDADHEMTCVYVYSPPEIIEQPADVEVAVGGPATFRVVAAIQYVSEVLSYQWRFNGADIPGAVADAYVIPTVTPADAGSYDVVVGNAGGFTTSQPAVLSVVGSSWVNGSFESGFDGWQHTGNVRVQAGSPAPDGTMVAGFNAGNTAPGGSVSQTFLTEPGRLYSMRFDLGLLSYIVGWQEMSVQVEGDWVARAETFRMIRAASSEPKMRWETKTMNFVANGPVTTITFRDVSRTTNGIDLLLDNVRFDLRGMVMVTTADDEDDGALGLGTGDSLREALAASASTSEANVIGFHSSLDGGTIVLDGTQLTVDSDVEINAAGLPGGITVSGDSVSRVFEITGGHVVSMRGLSVSSGAALFDDGGGILNAGFLYLGDVTVADNSVTTFLPDFRAGGGIHNTGILHLNACTVSGNSAGSYATGGGIYNAGDMVVVNSTLSGNSSVYGPGGLDNRGNALVRNVTISNNHSLYDNPGGAWNLGVLELENSVIADNWNVNYPDPFDFEGVISVFSGNNIIGGDPMLAPLGDYGGRTQTMPPLPGSPAIDSGMWLPKTPVADQRGVSRPVGPAVDVGAVEAN